MSRQRFVALAAAALIVLAAALYLNARHQTTPAWHATPLLPTLAAELDTVTAVSVRKGGPTPTVTVHRRGEQWTVAERSDYPADLAKLHKLLISLSDAQVVEEKTTNPAEFPRIGVEDPSTAGATGAEVSVSAKDGVHALIIGKPSGEGDFARRAGDNQSFVVQPAISVETDPRFWIDSHLLDIPVASIERIDVKLAAGPSYTIKRVKPKEDEFALEGVPHGRKAADARTLAPSPSLGGGLTADDVAFVKDLDFSAPSTATITFEDGKTLSFAGIVVNDKHWIEVTAGGDAALAARTQGRAFELASYRYDALFRPLEQLLVPKETPAPKPAAGKSAAPGARPPAAQPGATGKSPAAPPGS